MVNKIRTFNWYNTWYKHKIMRKLLTGLFFFAIIFGTFGFKLTNSPEAGSKVKWHTWEEAVAANEKEKRKIFVDIYTDWCGWCKRMDKTTFNDPRVAAYLNKYFYPVKLNAEQKGDIEFGGYIFKYKALQRRGYHELAAALLDNKLSYPTTVFLTEDFKVDQRLPGYLDASKMLAVLTYLAEEKEKPNPKPWKQYEQEFELNLRQDNTTKSGTINTIDTKPQKQPRRDNDDSLGFKIKDKD